MDQRDIRHVLQMIPYGLYILTTVHEQQLHAMTCNWFTQISFDPLLVMVALQNQSHSNQLLQKSGAFAINVLGEDQSHLAQRMAVPHRINPHKLAAVPYHILDSTIAFLECEVRQSLDVEGDHTLFVGEVIAGAVTQHAEPLTMRDAGLRYK